MFNIRVLLIPQNNLGPKNDVFAPFFAKLYLLFHFLRLLCVQEPIEGLPVSFAYFIQFFSSFQSNLKTENMLTQCFNGSLTIGHYNNLLISIVCIDSELSTSSKSVYSRLENTWVLFQAFEIFGLKSINSYSTLICCFVPSCLHHLMALLFSFEMMSRSHSFLLLGFVVTSSDFS